jgi:hypothetical protein
MKLLAFALLAFLPLSAQITLTALATVSTQKAERTLAIEHHFYIVDYEYNPDYSEVPLTNPPGTPHYDATITISEVVDGRKKAVGSPFGGKYTLGGCYEDDPSTLIESALKDAKQLTPEIAAELKTQRDAIAFEQMPLYAEVGGVITITARGKRDLKAIVIDGKTLWGTVPPPSQTSFSSITTIPFSNGSNTVTLAK